MGLYDWLQNQFNKAPWNNARTPTPPRPPTPPASASGYSVFRPNYAQTAGAALALSAARNAPLQGILNQQYSNLQRTGQLTNALHGNERRSLSANYGFDVESLGVKGHEIGLDRQALSRVAPLLDSRAKMADQLRALLDPEYYERAAEIGRNTEVAKFRNEAETRSRGAMGSEGFHVDQEDIHDKNAFDQNELYRGLQRDVLSANDRIRSAYEDVAQNKDNLARLDLQARQLGIDRRRLASNLQLGLERMGLQNQISVNELLQRMGSNRVEYQMLGQRIFDQALQLAPIYQSASYLPPAMQAALGR